MRENSGRKKLSALIAAILLFLFLDPYFMWNLHNTTPLYAFLGMFMALLFFPNIDIRTKGRGGLFALLALLLMLVPLYENLNILGTIAVLCYIFVPFAKEDFAKTTFNYFLTIYSAIIGISAIVWTLSMMGYVHSTGTIPALNMFKSYNYYVYPLLVRTDTFSILERFMGPFDEPGVVGTISALILTVGKFNLKDVRLLIVFISGIISLSFFFYVIAGVYYIIHTLFVSKNKLGGIAVIALLSILVVLSLSSEELYNIMWSRFLWDEDAGTLAGDNRNSDLSRQLFINVAGTLDIFWGIGKTDEFMRVTTSDASIQNTIVQYGILFVSAYFYLFASYGWKYRKHIITYALFIFVLIGCMYQRPFLFEPEYLFLYSMMAMSCGDMMISPNT